MEKVRKDNRKAGAEEPQWGSRLMLRHYQIIGLALLAYEEQREGLLSKAEVCEKSFREGVAFVPVEVLESYLDDLMDLGVEDERLFLKRPRQELIRFLWSLAFLAIGSVVLILLLGNTIYMALSVAALAAALYLPFWQRSRSQVIRRLKLARVVTKEVNRRRGRDDMPLTPIHSDFHWKEFFSRGRTSSFPGAAQGGVFPAAAAWA